MDHPWHEQLNSELKGLYFIDASQKERLKNLMKKTEIVDSVSPWFIPLYIVSALPQDHYGPIDDGGIGMEALRSIGEIHPHCLSLMEFAMALSPLGYGVDLLHTFENLSESPWLELAFKALNLRFEL